MSGFAGSGAPDFNAEGAEERRDADRAAIEKRTLALAGEEGTGANRGNGDGNQNLCFLSYLWFNSWRGDEADFSFQTRDTQTPYLDARPLLMASEPELRKPSRAGSERDARAGCANTRPP